MVVLKNYYDLKKQLELCIVHLETLEEQKKTLETFLYPRTAKFKETPPSKSIDFTNPFLNYTYQIINIDKQITVVKREISILQKNINRMECILKDVESNLYKIFVYKYIEGLSVSKIAQKTNYSTRRIYQLLSKIDNILLT